jgi:hypothetical protein
VHSRRCPLFWLEGWGGVLCPCDHAYRGMPRRATFRDVVASPALLVAL